MAVLLLAFADQALASEVYQTPQQAEADVKRLCKESKAEDRPARDPGNAQ